MFGCFLFRAWLALCMQDLGSQALCAQEGSVWLLAQDEPVPTELMFGLLHVLADANFRCRVHCLVTCMNLSKVFPLHGMVRLPLLHASIVTGALEAYYNNLKTRTTIIKAWIKMIALRTVITTLLKEDGPLLVLDLRSGVL